MSHLRYFGLKCAGVSSGVSWFRRIGLGRLWNELLYYVQKDNPGARCECRTVMAISKAGSYKVWSQLSSSRGYASTI